MRLHRLPLVATGVVIATTVAALSTTPSAAGRPAAATVIESIHATGSGARTTVTLRGDGTLTPARVEEANEKPRRLVLDFANVTAKGPAHTAVNTALVKGVRVAVNTREPLVTRVVIEVADAATYHIERGGDADHELAVVFQAGAAPTTVMLAAPGAPETVIVEPEPAISLEQALANAAPLAVPEAPQVPAPVAAKPQVTPAKAVLPGAEAAGPVRTPGSDRATGSEPPATPATAVRLPRGQAPRTAPASSTTGLHTNDRQYTGKPVSIDIENADLRALIRLLINEGGLNVVFDPSVQGTIDIVLNEIPWDQALETILRANKLGYVAEGTIIRIAPLNVLAEEEAERRKLAEARALAGDLQVQTFSLSYAKAQDLQPLLTKSALSARGQIQVDQRTNTLIITDLPDRLQTASNLIIGLDRPEPQVEVEARIVQTTRDFAKAIGIQWGLNGRMTPDVGNTTNLAFPNRGTIGGRTPGVNAPNDPRSTSLEETGTAVNLPVNGASSAIGLALGAVNGAFNLDVALSALERSGKGRILSTPRLTTQNNVQAKVQQGVQIPIQTVANNTVTVTFKEAVLMLQVTPQITAAGTVIMQVVVTNMSADFSREVNGIPPIDTQEAHTQVQVEDGATTVIGGIFVSREQSQTDRTPALSRIPLLGWLFRRDSTQDESRELLIFITPRILKG
jgi:type IV pilus assembly protein PilQ